MITVLFIVLQVLGIVFPGDAHLLHEPISSGITGVSHALILSNPLYPPPRHIVTGFWMEMALTRKHPS
jgi:hypothetical protein